MLGDQNVQTQSHNSVTSLGKFRLQSVLFLMIFFCNIPFVFFAGKVALLAVVYECFYEEKETDQSEPRRTDFFGL